jgi:hypothetical protein
MNHQVINPGKTTHTAADSQKGGFFQGQTHLSEGRD